jgi:RNA recognition motif-containing protein
MDTLQGHMVGGRPVRINLKTDRKTQKDRPPTKTYDKGWRPQQVPSLEANENVYAFNRWERDDARSRLTAPTAERRRLYVGGLPQIPNQDSLNSEMRQLFDGYNVEAVSKLISPHQAKREQPGSHYFCYVDVPTAEDAQDAADRLNGKPTPYDGAYQVRIAHDKTMAFSSRREPQKQPSSTSRVYVGGLPSIPSPEGLEVELRNLFAGLDFTVSSGLITPHPSKQSELREKYSDNFHYCFVEFPDATEAQKAVEAFDGQPTPAGGLYKVRFAKDPPANANAQANGNQTRAPRRQQAPLGPPRDLSGSWRRA